ncbi:MAG: adenosine deaminase family protein [Terracidiphilus sp.]|jgi:adenosine deaminase
MLREAEHSVAILPSEIRSFIEGLPKAELHLHLEGAMRWSTVREVHPRRSQLPVHAPWQQRDRLVDFGEFLRIFEEYVKPATGTPELIERHVFEVLQDLAAQRVAYVELSVSLYFHTGYALDAASVLQAVHRGRMSGEQAFPITAKIIVGLSRRLAESEVRSLIHTAISTVDSAGRRIADGIDLHGDERLGLPDFLGAWFQKARKASLKTKAHAGETSGCASVLAALRLLKIREICHGIRVADSREAIQRIVSQGICLHACLTANIKLGAVPSLESHPFPALFDAGCILTVNSDDPLIFGTSVTDELLILAGYYGFSPSDIVSLEMNAFRSSLLTSGMKARFMEELASLADSAEQLCAKWSWPTRPRPEIQTG